MTVHLKPAVPRHYTPPAPFGRGLLITCSGVMIGAALEQHEARLAANDPTFALPAEQAESDAGAMGLFIAVAGLACLAALAIAFLTKAGDAGLVSWLIGHAAEATDRWLAHLGNIWRYLTSITDGGFAIAGGLLLVLLFIWATACDLVDGGQR